MRIYGSVPGFFMGNEFTIQFFLFALLFFPWRRRRSHFAIRGAASAAVYFFMAIGPDIPLPWYYLIVFAIMFAGIIFCFELGPGESLYYALNIYCAQHMVSGFSYATAYMIFGQGAEFFVYYIVSAVYMLVACGLVAVLWLRREIVNPLEIKINSPAILCVAALYLAVAIFISHYAPQSLPVNAWAAQAFFKLFTAMFGCAMFIVNVMNGSNNSLKAEKDILQLLLQKDKEQYEQARLSAERINIKYHDLKQKANLGSIDKDEFKEVGGYTEYFTGNRALDIVLGEVAAKCREQNIRFICTADGTALGEMKPYHIYSLLGNCLENAIEGLADVPDEKREIRLMTGKRNDMCVIHAENSFNGKCVIRDGLPQTTKADRENHGYGVKSIRNIAELYGGKVCFSAENGLFVTLVMIPSANLCGGRV